MSEHGPDEWYEKLMLQHSNPFCLQADKLNSYYDFLTGMDKID